jgi:tRNA(Ile2) C34 agmatinyltransferase TiaS
MEIKLDEAAVQQAVSAAVLEQLGADGQRTLVEAALLYLMTPPKDAYRRNAQSPLQDAFNAAVGAAARKIVLELVEENEEFKEKIRTQVGEAFIKMEATNFTDYLGTALSDALRKES